MVTVSKLRQPFLWSAFAAALLAATLLALCVWGIAWHHGIPVELGWEAGPRGDHWIIRHVDSEGPAYGKLLPGDVIVAIDGSTRAAHFGPLPVISAGSGSYTSDVRRKGDPLHTTIRLWQTPGSAWELYSYLLMAVLNLGLAIWIGTARPDYAAARVAFFLFLGTAMTFASAVLVKFYPPVTGIALGFALVISSHAWQPLEFAVAYDFSLRFPEPVSQPRVLRLGRILFYSVGAVLWLLGVLPLLAQALHLGSRSALLPAWFSLFAFDPWRPVFVDAIGALALLSVPLILGRNYRKLADAPARRRLRWVALSISLAILPVAVGVALKSIFLLSGHDSATDKVESFLNTVASFATLLAPIGLTYAIVKHRILGIRFAVRRGVQYLLARNVLRIVFYLPLIGIVADLALHPKEPMQDFLLNKSWWFYLFLAATAWVSLRYRTPLTSLVDKRFFRSAYEEEVILSELMEQIRACESSDAVARIVVKQVVDTLYPSAACMLLKSESLGRLTNAYPDDSPLASYFRDLFNEHMRQRLQSQRPARTLSELAKTLGDPSSVFNDDRRNTLVMPINSPGDELLGVLLLGERKSEQPYSKRDRKLLQFIATQIALALEMFSLKEKVREEGRVRVEVLGHLDREHIQLMLECPLCGRCYSGSCTHCDADGAPLAMTLPIERVIDAKYRLDRRIGAGGMGAVYEAYDLRLDRIVAVKVMTGRLFGNNVALRRFEREARAVARLQHPNIVAIYDFGSLRGDGAYLVMEFLAGRSWRAEMSCAGPVACERVAAWFDQLCDAMAYAHASGIIHRDLKPENVLVYNSAEKAPKITIVDFGLAKLQSRDMNELLLLTEDAVLGTLGYMSPEQRAGERVDARTDIYSLGVMVAETLTNSPPPRFGASDEWLASVLPLRDSMPALRELVRLLRGCLAHSLAERLSDVRELRRDLIPLIRECPVLARDNAAAANSNTVTAVLSLPIERAP